MRRIILLIVTLVITSRSHSQILIENFEYPSGDLLTAHGWTAISGAGINSVKVTPSGLSFPSYIGSGIGNGTYLSPNYTSSSSGEDCARDFNAVRDTGSVYGYCMIKVDTGRSGDYFFAFVDSGSTTLFKGRINARLNAGALNFGITKGANGDAVVWGTGNYSFDSTYLVVLKYTFVSGTTTDDLVSLFVFSSAVPVPLVEPAPAIGPSTFPSADAVKLGRVLLRQGTNSSTPTVEVDGIYVDTYWNSGLLPVELSSFNSIVKLRDVILNWTTLSEINNSGFDVERSSLKDQVLDKWIKIGFVNGSGTNNSAHNYSFIDRNLSSGKYTYRLKQIDYNGNFEYFNLTNDVEVGIPEKFSLSQNYPNPFNPSTNINFNLPFDAKVTMKIFDVSGREISSIPEEERSAGYHTVSFNASDLSSGIYFYRIYANSNGKQYSSVKRMILLK